jgi:hypothetical protein
MSRRVYRQRRRIRPSDETPKLWITTYQSVSLLHCRDTLTTHVPPLRYPTTTVWHWHFECPSRDCTAPVVLGDAGFTTEQAKALRANDPPSLPCKACGTPMVGYLQAQRYHMG